MTSMKGIWSDDHYHAMPDSSNHNSLVLWGDAYDVTGANPPPLRH